MSLYKDVLDVLKREVGFVDIVVAIAVVISITCILIYV